MSVNKRIPIIAGNWKMYKDVSGALELISDIKTLLPFPGEVDVVVAPSFVLLPAVAKACMNSYIGVAAQDMHWEAEGAFTGEVSGAMIKDLGCEYVIIGHSERRQYFAETDESVNKKVLAAFRYGLTPIVCVGEMLSEREAGNTLEVLERQLGTGLPPLGAGQAQNLIIAYEPVWAIGTGRTATPDQAEEVHSFIRGFLSDLYGKETADVIRIQYGGSVKPENAGELLRQTDIDGALVGGASLTADWFVRIIQSLKG